MEEFSGISEMLAGRAARADGRTLSWQQCSEQQQAAIEWHVAKSGMSNKIGAIAEVLQYGDLAKIEAAYQAHLTAGEKSGTTQGAVLEQVF